MVNFKISLKSFVRCDTKQTVSTSIGKLKVLYCKISYSSTIVVKTTYLDNRRRILGVLTRMRCKSWRRRSSGWSH